MSSITTTTPSWPLSSSVMSLWKISGADEIPNGSLLKQNLPMGVMKVVSFWLSGSRGICQKPLEASSAENTFAPASLGAMSSSVGNTYSSRLTALFSLLRSTHTLTWSLFFFSAGTMGAHQSVGPVTCSIMPNSNMRPSSFSTLGRRGNGTRRGVVAA